MNSKNDSELQKVVDRVHDCLSIHANRNGGVFQNVNQYVSKLFLKLHKQKINKFKKPKT